MIDRNKFKSITIRVTPEFKALITRLAIEENRTMTSYIEWLVKKDARRKARTDPKTGADESQ